MSPIYTAFLDPAAKGKLGVRGLKNVGRRRGGSRPRSTEILPLKCISARHASRFPTKAHDPSYDEIKFSELRQDDPYTRLATFSTPLESA